jgi:nicotinamide-nucleotide amidase
VTAPEASDERAAALVAAMTQHGLTVAVAESLTGGLVCAALTDVPGASAVVRGGVVAYATDSKASVLGVDPDLLARFGPVSVEVAGAMARAVRERFGARVGLATTGVAGPDEQDGHPVGEVHVAVDHGDGGGRSVGDTRSLSRPGSRIEVRAATVAAALDLLAGTVELLADEGTGSTLPDR